MSLAAVATALAATATALATAATTFSCSSYCFAVVEVSLSALYFLAYVIFSCSCFSQLLL